MAKTEVLIRLTASDNPGYVDRKAKFSYIQVQIGENALHTGEKNKRARFLRQILSDLSTFASFTW
jgi:hypothetical protein